MTLSSGTPLYKGRALVKGAWHLGQGLVKVASAALFALVSAPAAVVVSHLSGLVSGFGFQDGFSLAHTTLVVVSEGFRGLQNVSGSAVNALPSASTRP